MRKFAIGGVVLVFVLVGGAALGLSVVTSGGEPADATITTFEPQVAVGNESTSPGSGSGSAENGSGSAENGSGEAVTCTEPGPLPGHASLAGRLVLERPVGDEGPTTASFRVVVTVGDGTLTETHTATLEPGGSERFLLLGVAEQPPSLSGGGSTTVHARVTTEYETENETVANATRTVDVVERPVPCADERGN